MPESNSNSSAIVSPCPKMITDLLFAPAATPTISICYHIQRRVRGQKCSLARLKLGEEQGNVGINRGVVMRINDTKEEDKERQ